MRANEGRRRVAVGARGREVAGKKAAPWLSSAEQSVEHSLSPTPLVGERQRSHPICSRLPARSTSVRQLLGGGKAWGLRQICACHFLQARGVRGWKEL